MFIFVRYKHFKKSIPKRLRKYNIIIIVSQMVVFHFIRSNTKSLQVSWILLSILADFSKAVLWIVSIRAPIFSYSTLFTNSLWTVPCAPVRIDITLTLLFHSFLSSLARSEYWLVFLLSLIFTLWSGETAKSSFLVIITRYELLVGIR